MKANRRKTAIWKTLETCGSTVEGGRVLEKNRGFAVRRNIRRTDHGLAQHLTSAKRLPQELVARLELAVHLVGKMVVSSMMILLIAGDNDVIH
jgi:hypothetical protein